MRLSARRGRGFTLIELLISLAIFGLLLLLGVPNYVVWVADSQIRNAAESISSGLRVAQGKAVSLNQPVRFTLDPTTGTGGWVVQLDNPPNTQLQVGTFAEGSEKVTFTAVPAAATEVTYTGLGRITANTDATATVNTVKVTYPAIGGSRALSVVLGTAGHTGIKVCDPNLPATDTMGCP